MNKIRILLAALLMLALPAMAHAQTAVDQFTITAATPCQGASTGGALSCPISGVPAGALVGVCVAANSGTLSMTVTETTNSSTVTCPAGMSKQTTSSPANITQQCYTPNANHTSYTFKSVVGAGTVAQTLIPFYITGVTTSPFDVGGAANNGSGSATQSGTTTAGLAHASEIAVQCFGGSNTETTIVAKTDSPAWSIPSGAKELTNPSMALLTTVTSTTSGIGASAPANYQGNYTVSNAATTSNVVIGTYAGACSRNSCRMERRRQRIAHRQLSRRICLRASQRMTVWQSVAARRLLSSPNAISISGGTDTWVQRSSFPWGGGNGATTLTNIVGAAGTATVTVSGASCSDSADWIGTERINFQ